MGNVNSIKEMVDKKSGAWKGCDWATDFGSLKLNLDGISSEESINIRDKWEKIEENILDEIDPTLLSNEEARDIGLIDKRLFRVVWEEDWEDISNEDKKEIAKIANQIAEEWDRASDWLLDVEDAAEEAEDNANDAVAYLKEGDFRLAFEKADEARRIESEYGDTPTWGFLYDEIKELEEWAEDIFNSADEGGTIQSGEALELFSDPTLHTTMSVRRALSELGFSSNAVQKVLEYFW